MKKILLIFGLNFLLLSSGLAQTHFEYGKLINQTNDKISKEENKVLNGNDNNSILINTPTLISPANHSIVYLSFATLQWKSVDSAFEYEFQVSKDSTFNYIDYDAFTNNSIYNYTNVQCGNTYYWRVQASSGSHINKSSWSEIWNFTTLSSSDTILYLASPADSTYLDVGAGKPIILKWNPVCGASKYRLEVSPNSDFNVKFYDSSNVYSSIILPLYGWQSCMAYYWRVSAYNSIGELINQSEVWKFTLRMSDPDAPELISPMNTSVIDSSTVTLQWHPYKGDLPYTLELSKDSTFATLVEIDTALTDTSYTLKYLDLFTKYYWRVRSENNCYISEWSKIWNFSITYHISVLTLISPHNNSIKEFLGPSNLTVFVWNSIKGAEYYNVEISTNSNFNSVTYLLGNLTDTTCSTTILICGINYYWRVSGYDITGKSIAKSDIWSFIYRTSVLSTPELTSPINDTTTGINNITLNWQPVTGAPPYSLQVSTDTAFPSDCENFTDIPSNSFHLNYLDAATKYYWRVRAENGCNISDWSDSRYFKTSENMDDVSDLENNSTNKLSIYPNPAINSINIIIQYSYSSNVVLKIINECGIEIIKKDIDNQNNIGIDVSNLSSGIYYCILNSGGTSIAQKFSVVK